jgi:predicted metal-dependent phosphoesterase TrpH
MEWLQANWVNVFAAIGGIVTAATLIVKLTPTTKDDEVVGKVREVWDKIVAAIEKLSVSKKS